MSKHQVSHIEGALSDIAVMVAAKLLLVPSVPEERRHSVLLKAVEVDLASLLCFSFVVVLDPWCSKCDISGEDSLRPVDKEEGGEPRGATDLSPETPEHVRQLGKPPGGLL